MKLGVLNKLDTFILRWDYNRDSLLQSPVIAGLGDSWLAGIGTSGNDRAFRKVEAWLKQHTENATYINYAEGGFATNQFMPSNDLYRDTDHDMNITRALRNGANIIVLFVTGNDYFVYQHSKETWLENLKSIRAEADKFGAEVFVTTSRPSRQWDTGTLRSYNTDLNIMIRNEFPNHYIDVMESAFKATIGDNTMALDPDYESVSSLDHPNEVGAELIKDLIVNKLNSFYVDKGQYQEYVLERSINGVDWEVFQTLSSTQVSLELPYTGNLFRYRVRAHKNDQTYTPYTDEVEVQRPDRAIWAMSGNIGTESAEISCKIGHIRPLATKTIVPKILTIQYHKNDDIIRYYVNGQLANSLSRASRQLETQGKLVSLYIGSNNETDDLDRFLTGKVCEVVLISGVVSEANRKAYENHLASKWLPTGTVLGSGYVTPASAIAAPTLPSNNHPYLILNENGINADSNGKVTTWVDQTSFGGILTGVPTLPGTAPRVTQVKGRNCIQFDGGQSMNVPIPDGVPGMIQANYPDDLTWMYVFQIDAYDATSSNPDDNQKVVMGAHQYEGMWGVEIWKSHADQDVKVRLNDYEGRNTGSIPIARSYFVEESPAPNLPTGTVRLKYGYTNDLQGGVFTSSVDTFSDSNGVAKFNLSGLVPGATIYYQFEVDGEMDNNVNKLRTVIPGAHTFEFCGGSCNTFGYSPTFDFIRERDPIFLGHLGDLHYRDIGINDINLFRDALDAQLVGSSLGKLLRNVPFEYVWDDHCFGPNNSDRHNPAKPAVTAWFRENFPHQSLGSSDAANGIYRAWTIGRVRFIMTDGRYNRDRFNEMLPTDPNKILLGQEQLNWFKSELLSAKNDQEIAMIVWLSPVPYSGDPNDPFGFAYYPEGESITDPGEYSFSMIGETYVAYQAERREIANYLYDNQIENVVIVQGDTHMSAIDDGRNMVYATTASNNFQRRDWTSVPEALRPVCIEASPFDRDPDRGGGPFQINDAYNSGGPYPMVYQAASFFKVVDRGENWIQLIIEQWYRNQDTGEWVFNRKYGRNYNAIGNPGIPPPFDQDPGQEEMAAPNGYVSDGKGNWKQVAQRFIGREGEWKPQRFKWVGKNGYWKLVYTAENIDLQQPFYIRSLNGYTANPGNVIEIYGDRLSDSQYPIPRVGAFFELKQSYSDIFDNFASCVAVGAPKFETIDLETGLHILAEGDYMKTSDNPTSGISGANVLGAYGDNSYGMGFWVYLPTSALPASGKRKWILFSGQSEQHFGLYINGNDQTLRWVHKSSAAVNEAISNIVFPTDQWVKIAVNRDGIAFSNSKLYIDNAVVGQFSAQVNPVLLFTDVLFLGAGYIEGQSTDVPTTLDPLKTAGNILLTNQNKTFAKSVNSDNYTSSRTKGTVPANSGRYYFEVRIDSLTSGRVLIGLGDVGVDPNADARTTAWLITGSSGTYTRSTDRLTWASGGASYGQGDIVGILLDTDNGSVTVYINGISKGKAFSNGSISVPVEAVVLASQTGVSTVRFAASEWTHMPDGLGVKQLPESSENTSGILSSIGMYINNFYSTRDLMRAATIERLYNKPVPEIVLQDKISAVEYIIPQKWRLSSNNQKFAFTLPTEIQLGNYDLFVRSLNLRTIALPINVEPFQKVTGELVEDFTDMEAFRSRWYFMQKAWGGANGGVVAANGGIEGGELILRANGDLYDGSVQGVDRDGNPKFHTHPNDPMLGKPWKRRVGCCIVSRENYGFGSYRILAKVAPLTGVASAFWTFHYEEIYPGDPRWQGFIAEGLEVQGNQEDGYYITRNHEIDIEQPSNIGNDPLNQVSFTNAKLNTWRGETEDNYTANLTKLREDMDITKPIIDTSDGDWHEFRWDWHQDRVDFYIDNSFIRSNIEDVPDIPGKISIGVWFPSYAGNSENHPNWREQSPWLPNPDGAWAGVGANWYQQEMRIREIRFTPFNEPGERLIGETYPFGGARFYDGNALTDGPVVPTVPSAGFSTNLVGKNISGQIRIYDANDTLLDTQVFAGNEVTNSQIVQPLEEWRMEIDVTNSESQRQNMDIYIGGQKKEFFYLQVGEERKGLKYPYPSGVGLMSGNILLDFYTY